MYLRVFCQFKKCSFLNLCNIRRNCYIIISRHYFFGFMADFFDKFYKKCLHIIKIGNHTTFNRKRYLDIIRCFFVHFKSFITKCKNLCFVCYGYYVLLVKECIFIFVVYFDITGSYVQSVNILCHIFTLKSF